MQKNELSFLSFLEAAKTDSDQGLWNATMTALTSCINSQLFYDYLVANSLTVGQTEMVTELTTLLEKFMKTTEIPAQFSTSKIETTTIARPTIGDSFLTQNETKLSVELRK